MCRKMILIGGYLASGKSTFAQLLSKTLSIPCLMKDTFKIQLCTNISITNREESSRFSAVTFDAMMYVTERLLEAGYPILLEGNFVPAGVKKQDEAGTIRKLLEKYRCPSLTYQFYGDTQVLYKRFLEREKSPQRGQANRMPIPPSYEEFCGYCHNLDGFSVGGESVQIDTTDFSKVDVSQYIETARRFLAEEKS